MNFYNALELALQQKGMNASYLCAKAGIHPSYISKLKSGHTKDVTWEKGIKLVQALGMTLDEFHALQTSDDVADGEE